MQLGVRATQASALKPSGENLFEDKTTGEESYMAVGSKVNDWTSDKLRKE